MHCTRCGNPLIANTRECQKCGYVLTADEFEEGLELEKEKANSKNKEKPKKEKVIKERVVKIKLPKRQVTIETASEVTIIKDTSRDPNKYVSNSRFLGYFLLICCDFSLLASIWYLIHKIDTLSIVLSALFFIVSIAFGVFGVFLIKSAGVDSNFLKEKSTITAIVGLIVALIAFILLMIELSQNNLLLIFIAIGLFIIGFVSFMSSILAKESQNKGRK